MSLTVINRVAELRNALYKTSEYRHRQDVMHDKAIRGVETMLFFTRREAPKGSVEPSWATPRGTINHGRPSIRQHGITLDASMVQGVERTTNGAAFMITSNAPHAFWQIYGTPPHPISGRPLLAFWWGSPLRWSPYRGGKPGAYHFPSVSHPGTPPNNFPLRAAIQNRPTMLQLTRQAVREIAQPLYSFFQGRGIRRIVGG